MTPQGKEKIILDKDQLLLTYFHLEKAYNKNLDDDIQFAFFSLEKATGYTYERTLKRYEEKKRKVGLR
jgi:hypothetical protein